MESKGAQERVARLAWYVFRMIELENLEERFMYEEHVSRHRYCDMSILWKSHRELQAVRGCL